MKHPIGTTRNGIPFYAQLVGTEAGRHIARHPQLLVLAKETLQRINAEGPVVNIEYDMKRSVGYSYVAETTEKDVVFYARIAKDELYTRFVKNAKPSSTSYLTATLTLDEDGEYELTTIQVGQATPPRIGSSDETNESKRFWEDHAVILTDQSLQMQTVTKLSPY